MCLKNPRFPAGHDLSLAANTFPVSLLKTTIQEWIPEPEFIPLACFIAGVVCQLAETYYYIQSERFSGSLLHSRL